MRGAVARGLRKCMRGVYERRGVCEERTQVVSASVCKERVSEGVYARLRISRTTTHNRMEEAAYDRKGAGCREEWRQHNRKEQGCGDRNINGEERGKEREERGGNQE
jgi:hypothetical protein